MSLLSGLFQTWEAAGDRAGLQTQSCNCIGPQDGQPRCPCMMRGVIERDGRWIVPEQDLGPTSAAYRNAQQGET